MPSSWGFLASTKAEQAWLGFGVIPRYQTFFTCAWPWSVHLLFAVALVQPGLSKVSTIGFDDSTTS